MSVTCDKSVVTCASSTFKTDCHDITCYQNIAESGIKLSLNQILFQELLKTVINQVFNLTTTEKFYRAICTEVKKSYHNDMLQTDRLCRYDVECLGDLHLIHLVQVVCGFETLSAVPTFHKTFEYDFCTCTLKLSNQNKIFTVKPVLSGHPRGKVRNWPCNTGDLLVKVWDFRNVSQFFLMSDIYNILIIICTYCVRIWTRAWLLIFLI